MKEPIKGIDTIGSPSGIAERGNKPDNLYQPVEALTGKDSASSLTKGEAGKLLAELTRRMSFAQSGAPEGKPESCPAKPGGLTAGQQKNIRKRMRLLRDPDETPGLVSSENCPAGIVMRQFGTGATGKQPFRRLNDQQGKRLIEILKGYVESAGRKAKAARGESG